MPNEDVVEQEIEFDCVPVEEECTGEAPAGEGCEGDDRSLEEDGYGYGV